MDARNTSPVFKVLERVPGEPFTDSTRLAENLWPSVPRSLVPDGRRAEPANNYLVSGSQFDDLLDGHIDPRDAE